MPRTTDLGPAHRGYEYQDLFGAYLLAQSLIGVHDAVTFDRKGHDQDVFDDLTAEKSGHSIRRQIKSAASTSRRLVRADLTHRGGALQIDELVTSFRLDAPQAGEYRVCASWLTPDDPALLCAFEAVPKPPSVRGSSARCFRLRPEAIWPVGARPTWRRLESVSRDDFVSLTDRLVIELECPAGSSDLTNPGPLEFSLLEVLSKEIGIGRYPNQERSLADVAATLIRTATNARSGHLRLPAASVVRAVNLRTDYGRIPQVFPYQEMQFVPRAVTKNELISALERGARLILSGAPGSGKSWVLTDLANTVRGLHTLEARHYCYLQPGDPGVGQRIESRTLFGNLVAEILDQRPELRQEQRPLYSSGPDELRSLLRRAVEQDPDLQIILIVDGLDHIGRLLPELPTVSPGDANIVEELALLELPERTCLILGSQPGPHLAPLESISQTISMRPWVEADIRSLAERVGLIGALEAEGFSTGIDEVISALNGRAEGNPLYATFICRELMGSLARRALTSPVEAARMVPQSNGDLATYYNYLLGSVDATPELADRLGMIDFAMTAEEFAEALPGLAHRIPAALQRLEPVLERAPGNAYRIYHESFRRYIHQRLEGQGARIDALLAPVIEWLNKRGFYSDSRCYRYLVPTLRRAGRADELFALLGPDFVSRSLVAGQPQAAIRSNLVHAIDAAAKMERWAMLVRMGELLRAVHTCFEEKLTDVRQYAHCYLELHGPAAMGDRLLFEGRPTQSRRIGLLLCSMVDDAGGIPPWAEYLTQDDEEEDPDPDHVSIAGFHGYLQLRGIKWGARVVTKWLRENPTLPWGYASGILARLGEEAGAEVLASMVGTVGEQGIGASVVNLELARQLWHRGDSDGAAAAATRALPQAISPEIAFECLRYGASRESVALHLPDLSAIDIGLHGERYHLEASDVRRWLAAVGIAARVRPEELDPVWYSLRGVGWYRCWLRFALLLPRAEALAAADPEGSERAVLEAFREASSDTGPFRGRPRACDLYSIHGEIRGTFRRALRLLRTAEGWQAALSSMAAIGKGTTTYLQNQSSGPLEPEALAELLAPHASNPVAGLLVLESMRAVAARAQTRAEFYETQAAIELYLIRALAATGQGDEAEARWKVACTYLTGYGFHKDITIYELLAPIPVLAGLDQGRTRRILSKAQRLAQAAADHTDGKETRYAPNTWFEGALRVDAPGACRCLAQALTRRGGVIDWRLEDALKELSTATLRDGDPRLVLALTATTPNHGKARETERELATVERVLAGYPSDGKAALVTCAARVQGDAPEVEPAALDCVDAALERHGVRLAMDETLRTAQGQSTGEPYTIPWKEGMGSPPLGSEPLDIVRAFRSAPSRYLTEDRDHSRLTNAVGYRLVALLQQDREQDAVRVLRAFSTEYMFASSATPLAVLAEGLERHGYREVAALAYCLAFSRSRGGGGWLQLGGETHEPWLRHALSLAPESVKCLLADEIARHLIDSEYNAGVTRHLVRICSALGDDSLSFECWDTSYEVIAKRLPGSDQQGLLFGDYAEIQGPPASLDEGLVEVVLARLSHPEHQRKLAGLAALASVLSSRPEISVSPIRRALRADTPFTSLLLILQCILASEQTPYPLSTALTWELESLSGSASLGLSETSRRLLERAGLPVPERVMMPAPLVIPSHASSLRNRIGSIDNADRLEAMTAVWPPFVDLLVRRYEEIWDKGAVNEDRERARWEAAKDHVRASLPPTPLLHWHQEIFELAFLDTLAIAVGEVGRNHEMTEQDFERLQTLALPPLQLHVARWRSRAPRPSLPHPSESRTALGVPEPLTEPGSYHGWYRAARYERELQFQDRPLGDVLGQATVTEGLIPADVRHPEDGRFVPLQEGDPDTWVVESRREAVARTRGPSEVAFGLAFLTDFLGWYPLLTMSKRLIARCCLSPAQHSARLHLVDRDGRDGVCFRWWSVRPCGENFDEETPTLVGCDLVVRPDVFEVAAREYGGRLIHVRSVRIRDQGSDESRYV